jgi:hypothetical protein
VARLPGTKMLTGLAILWFLLAPLPPGIALNLETKECAGYWAGDEYVDYVLPEGWVAYELGSQNRIETEIGACTYTPSDEYGAAESCCRELGCTYVGDEIGKRRSTPLGWRVLAESAVGAGGQCLAIGLVLAIVVGGILLLRRNRRKREAPSDGEMQPRSDDAEQE